MNQTLLAAAVASALAAGQAYAADVEYSPSVAMRMAPYDWAGPYVGVFGGFSRGQSEFGTGTAGGGSTLNVEEPADGLLGGAQVGYDWQLGTWVVGAIADIAVTSNNASFPGDFGGVPLAVQSEVEYLGTLRARMGYVWNRLLAYGHGGLAYGRTRQEITLGGISTNSETSRSGWTVGGGLEYALTDRLSLGAEHAYTDLGSEIIYDDGMSWVDDGVTFHSLRAILNLRF